MDRIKHRDTGQIISIWSTCSDGTMTGYTSLGESVTVNSVDVGDDESFTWIRLPEFDLSSVLDNAKNIMQLGWDFKRTLQAIARFLHPGGYFHVGDIVYIVPGTLVSREYGYSSHEGPEHAFEVTEIRLGESIPFSYILTIKKRGCKNLDSGTIEFRFRTDFLSVGDAFYCLARYGMEY